MKASKLSILFLGLGLVACSEQNSQNNNSVVLDTTPTVQAISCESLSSASFENTIISTVETVAAGTFEAPVAGFPGFGTDYSSLPSFCRVTGSIQPTADSDIQFELWLPTQGWNGKFMQTGNGGAAGSIVYNSLIDPLMRGYAVANTDTGHKVGRSSFSWAVGHPEKLTDFAYRAVHELTVVGKAITSTRYGKLPDKSYFNGCSTGGRQALKEAQRYPEDYDAIIAGAPANNWSALMAESILIQSNLGPDKLGIDKLGILKEAALASCDSLDGVTDRVISQPSMCNFDPAITQCGNGQTEQCLSENEVSAAKRIYSGVVNNAGDILMPGTGAGSEPLWAAYASPGFSIGADYFRDIVMADSNWDTASFNAEADLRRAEQLDNGSLVAMEPDISEFIAHGGKLIMYHGTTDGLIPFANSINYFESMLSALGEDLIDESVKFYLVPGMDHCSGGEGAHAVDWLSAMEEWADEAVMPVALQAFHPAAPVGAPGSASSAGDEFTRSLCPYPEVSRYTGSGNENDAANFECVAL